MALRVRFTPDRAGIDRLLSIEGPVDAYILEKAILTQRFAEREAPRGPKNNPVGERIKKTEPELAKSIKVVRDSARRAWIVRANTSYAIFVHQGTKPHPIKPVRASLLRFAVKEERTTGEPAVVFAKKVNHPGSAPNPFLVRALRQALR